MRKISEFIRVNGYFVFAEEVGSRLARSFRSHILARRLKTTGLLIGSHSHLRGLDHMQIGKHFHAGSGLWLEAVTRYDRQTFSPRIVIGDNVSISHWVHIAATHRVEIGEGCLFGSKVMVTDHNHGQYSKSHSSPEISPDARLLDSDRTVLIGRNVWLGDSVFVGPGAVIGEGCVVGANSVVKGSLPPFTISSGNPAKIVKSFDFARNEWVRCESMGRPL